MSNTAYRFRGLKRVEPISHIEGMVSIVTLSGRFFSLPKEIFNELFEADPRSQEEIDAISAITGSWFWLGYNQQGQLYDEGNCLHCLIRFTFEELRRERGTYPASCPVCGYEGGRKPKKETIDDGVQTTEEGDRSGDGPEASKTS